MSQWEGVFLSQWEGVFFSKEVVPAQQTGLLIGRLDGGLGGGSVPVLLAGVQLCGWDNTCHVITRHQTQQGSDQREACWGVDGR